MLVLGSAALRSEDAGFRVVVYEIMQLFDEAVNIPLFSSMLITGLVMSLRTKWGLFRHWWGRTRQWPRIGWRPVRRRAVRS